MGCNRGCEGTPICNALDLCCIQFRHDCGKECNGVAEGYSTLQVNVDGELEICSNVGGVCDCTALCCVELQTAQVDINPVITIDWNTPVLPFLTGVTTGIVLPWVMNKDGDVVVHFNHHLRNNTSPVQQLTGGVNVQLYYSIDGGALATFNTVHAFARVPEQMEQHMSSIATLNLAAGAHTIEIFWGLTQNTMTDPSTIGWNQTQVMVQWLNDV